MKNSGGNSAQSIVHPTNQHGTTTANIKESYENQHGSTAQNIAKYKKNFASVYKKYASMRNEIIERDADTDLTMSLTRDAIVKDLCSRTEDSIAHGVNRAIREAKRGTADKKIPVSLINERIHSVTNGILKDIKKRLEHAESKEEKRAAFDAIEYRLRFLCEEIVDKAYWFGYVKACAQLKVPEVYVDFGQNGKSKDKESHHAIINPRAFALDDIPSYNAYCTCKLGLRKAGE